MLTAHSTLPSVLVSKHLVEVPTPGWITTGYPQGVTYGAFKVFSFLQGMIAGLLHGALTGPGNPGSRGLNFMCLNEVLSPLGWRGDVKGRPLVAWGIMGSVSNLCPSGNMVPEIHSTKLF